ncbi:MAG: M28 family peptidase, partial [Candidatus Krumholzibacteria bacterium]|nr:M28 family peptidase [Candidatus Krumholzibacteria bacterium]
MKSFVRRKGILHGISAAVGLIAFTTSGTAEIVAQDYERCLESIDPLAAYRYCRELASPKYSGRLTGHEGYTAAASWAAGKFAGWGLRPLPGAEDFLLPFPCPYTVVRSSSMTLLLRDGEGAPVEKELEAPDDFLPMLFTDGGSAEAAFVFAGWGIHAPELGYDDYEGIDATGRFVICFRGTPDRERIEFEEHDHHRRRMETARRMGAAGLFYIYEEPLANPNGERIEGFLCGIVSEAVTDTLLRGTGWQVESLRDTLALTRRTFSFPLNAGARFSAEVEHDPDAVGYNVAAMLSGSDPSSARTCVVVGAHLDHCGAHMGMIFPGAQDNASGSAVVMEIARAFSSLG